jgi:hypothetical protein
MKILIGCDVDPVLPPVLRRAPVGDIWQCLDNLDHLIVAAQGALPPITWLIRADESVRFASGDFASGYTAKRSLWQKLLTDGHELGWHMHLMSFDKRQDCFAFDPEPSWLPDACGALSAHYTVRSTRTGWDYANNALFQQLETLGIEIDFSALPGNLAWYKVGRQTLPVDWSRCPDAPYHPSADDYQRPGNLNLLEIPITQFPNPISGIARRVAMRLKNGCLSLTGLRHRTKTVAERWDDEPKSGRPIWAFYFHPEELAGHGLDSFLHNLEYLRNLPNAEFVTASGARQSVTQSCSRD